MKPLNFIAIVFAILVVAGCASHEEKILSAYQRLNEHPKLENARKMLLVECDGADCYLKNSLVARSMIEQPDLFLSIMKHPNAKESQILRKIDLLRERCFEYHPDQRPPDFDRLYRKYYIDRIGR